MVATELLLEYAVVIATLLVLEAVLSFDNAAILAALVRRLPRKDRRKALMYGLVGAYALRITAIFLATFLLENPWLKLVGGAYLLYLGIRHAVHLLQKKEEHHHIPEGGPPSWLTRLGVPALVATIIQIELVDLAFALDQVVAAVGFVEHYPHPDRLYLIIIASVIGILALRFAAVLVVRVMDWLPLLEHMAYLAVAFVGTKLVLGWEGLNQGHGYHINDAVSIGVTLGLFVTPVVVKLLFDVPKSRPHEDAERVH